MKVVKFLETWFHVVSGASIPQFEAGKFYPLTDETKAHLARGIAMLFDAPDEPTKAEAAAQKAQAAAERATAAAQAARDAADAAAEAQRIADLEAAQEVAAEAQRIAELKAAQEVADAEAQRMASEAEEAEAKRLADEAVASEAQRLADEAAAALAAVNSSNPETPAA